MQGKSFVGAVLAAALLLPTTEAKAFQATCSCEHYGSQLDGICEAYPQDGTRSIRYEWEPFGHAYLPMPAPSFQPWMVYSVFEPVCRSGLIVTVTLQDGQQSTALCRHGTSGPHC
jgi:hypothetical protein